MAASLIPQKLNVTLFSRTSIGNPWCRRNFAPLTSRCLIAVRTPSILITKYVINKSILLVFLRPRHFLLQTETTVTRNLTILMAFRSKLKPFYRYNKWLVIKNTTRKTFIIITINLSQEEKEAPLMIMLAGMITSHRQPACIDSLNSIPLYIFFLYFIECAYPKFFNA